MRQKDGDLWQDLWRSIVLKGPHAVKFTKVKGHATNEQVDSGLVRREDKAGHDGADTAANRGATVSQSTVLEFGSLYHRRHLLYRKFMCRVQHFIIGLKKEEKQKEKDKRES